MKLVAILIVVSFFLCFSQVERKAHHLTVEIHLTNVITGGKKPSARENVASAKVGNQFYVHGGRLGLHSFADNFFSYNLNEKTWSEIKTGEIKPQLGSHTMTHVDDKLWIIGGLKNVFHTSDAIYTYDLQTEAFKQVAVTGDAPPRFHHCAAAIDKKIIVFGGITKEQSANRDLNDAWMLDTETASWVRLDTTGDVPPPVNGHQCVVLGEKMYVFGGQTSGQNMLQDSFELNIPTGVWTKFVLPLKLRAYHTVSLMDKYAVFFGGKNKYEEFDDVKLLNLVTLKMATPTISGTIPKRFNHAAFSHEGKVYIFGGRFDIHTKLNDIHMIDSDHSSTVAKEMLSQGKVELSSNVESLILKIRLHKNDVIIKAGQDLSKLLEKNTEEKKLLADISEKIKVWDEINTLSKQMSAQLAGLDNGTTTLEFDSRGIEQMSEDVRAKKELLKQKAEQMSQRLDLLKIVQEWVSGNASSKDTMKNVIHDETHRTDGLQDTIKKDLATEEELRRDIGKNNLQRNSLKDRLNVMTEHDSLQIKLRREGKIREEELDREITKLKEEIHSLEMEMEDKRAISDKINKEKSTAVAGLVQIKKAERLQNELKDTHDDITRKQNQFADKSKEFYNMLGIESSQTESQQEKNIRTYAEALESKRSAYTKTEEEKTRELNTVTAEIDALEIKLNELKKQATNAEKEMEATRNQAAHVERELKAGNEARTKMESEVARLEESIEQKTKEANILNGKKDYDAERLAKLNAAVAHSKAKLADIIKQEDVAIADLNTINEELKTEYESLKDEESDYVQLNLRLQNTNRNIEGTMNAYEIQHQKYEQFKNQIIDKIHQVDYKLKFEESQRRVKDLESKIFEMEKNQTLSAPVEPIVHVDLQQ